MSPKRIAPGTRRAKRVAFCYDLRSGKELWKERIGSKFASTPLVSEGLAYFLSEEGETIVVKPGDKIDIVAKSKLPSETDELFRAAIVPCQGQLFIRSSKALYCIGK